MKIIYNHRILAALFFLSFSLAGCEKEDGMVLDRVEAPVLVTIEGTSFMQDEAVNVTATVYELDKSGILDHTVGIDSIPLANLAIQLKAQGVPVADLTTDASGKVNLARSWPELGLASPLQGNVVNLEWAGSYKGQAFVKQSRVQVK
ncbi:hypothetical protein GCM10023188_20980 [Pontibacter saemangeumensis]|uniref:Uncharacterized protein n=1 Tax=Pontibacter saemangeumensis TaxID=1084525 RepID=A0ABP8LNZ0_9BACT